MKFELSLTLTSNVQLCSRPDVILSPSDTIRTWIWIRNRIVWRGKSKKIFKILLILVPVPGLVCRPDMFAVSVVYWAEILIAGQETVAHQHLPLQPDPRPRPLQPQHWQTAGQWQADQHRPESRPQVSKLTRPDWSQLWSLSNKTSSSSVAEHTEGISPPRL